MSTTPAARPDPLEPDAPDAPLGAAPEDMRFLLYAAAKFAGDEAELARLRAEDGVEP